MLSAFLRPLAQPLVKAVEGLICDRDARFSYCHSSRMPADFSSVPLNLLTVASFVIFFFGGRRLLPLKLWLLQVDQTCYF